MSGEPIRAIVTGSQGFIGRALTARLRCDRWDVTEWSVDVRTIARLAALGSRAGGAIAAAWAVIHFLGREGYTELARRTLTSSSTWRPPHGLSSLRQLRIWPMR